MQEKSLCKPQIKVMSNLFKWKEKIAFVDARIQLILSVW
jgi:hypothetical protein